MGLFNSISFQISPLLNKNFPEVPLSQKLVVKYNGMNLEDSYSLAVDVLDKNPKRLAENQSLVLKDKYLWVQLKNKSNSSKDTWIKIKKSELFDKFGINEQEIQKLHKVKELEALIKSKIRQSLIKENKTFALSKIDRLFSDLLKSIYSYFVLYPTVKKIIHHKLDQKNSVEREEIYAKKSSELIQKVKKNLNQSDAANFFSDSMISKVIDDLLILESNKLQKKENGIVWDKTKIQSLNILRSLDFLQKNPREDSINELAKLNVFEIPFAEVAKIPFTEENSPALLKFWQTVINRLWNEGKLEELSSSGSERKVLLQESYALKFLEAYSYILKNRELKNCFHVYERYLQDLESFTLTSASSFFSKDFGQLAVEKEIYKNKIFSKDIKKDFPSLFSNYLVFMSNYIILDVEGFSNAFKMANKIIDNIDNTVSDKLDNTVEEINKKLTEEEKQYFPTGKIRKLIIRQIERAAVKEFSFTSTQLSNIQKRRKDLNLSVEWAQELIAQINNAKNIQEINKLFEWYGDFTRSFLLPSGFPVELSKQTMLSRCDCILSIEIIKAAYDRTNDVFFFRQILKGDLYLRKIEDKKIKITDANAIDPEIYQVLFSEKIVDELKEEHASFLTFEQHISLLEISDLCNKKKLGQLKLDSKEKEALHEFFESVRVDKEFIAKLHLLLGEEKSLFNDIVDYAPSLLKKFIQNLIPFEPYIKLPAGIHYSTLGLILYYIEEKEKLDKLMPEMQRISLKMESLFEKLDTDSSLIQKQDRLSLKEIGLLITVEKKYEIFKRALAEFGLLDVDPDFKEVKKCVDYFDKINKIISDETNKFYDSGDIFAYNASKMKQLKNKPLDYGQKLIAFITDGVMHGGKLYRNAKGKICTAEVFNKFCRDDFNIYQMAISDVWTFDVKPLFSKPIQEYLESKGTDWGKINRQYKRYENELLMRSFKKIENDYERRQLAGEADFAFLLNLFRSKKIKGHEAKEEKNFEELHNKFYSAEPIKEKMICSEFVSKVTLAALVHFNREISDDIMNSSDGKFRNRTILRKLEKKGVKISDDLRAYLKGERKFDHEVIKGLKKEWGEHLKTEGYSEIEIELVIRLNNKEILDLPYSRKERLKAIHPGRMIQLLADKHCIVKKGLPPTASLLFNFD